METPSFFLKGDHCVFLAVNSATLFFYSQGLPPENLEKYQSQRLRYMSLFEAVKADQKTRFPGLLGSVRFLGSKLKENDLGISAIYGNKEVIQTLENDRWTKRSNVSLHPLGPKEKTVPRFPLLIFNMDQNARRPHVWFCVSWDQFSQERSKHLSEGDVIPLVAVVARLPLA